MKLLIIPDSPSGHAVFPQKLIYCRTLGSIAQEIRGFHECRKDLGLPNLADPFVSRLYSTYLSFLPQEEFSYPLNTHEDARGSFTEFLRTVDRGQVSVNVTLPGITKGQHWHNSKNEKYLVVHGKAVIRFRKVYSDEVIEYPVSASRLEVVEIPTGYTHSIENVGDDELVTLMWANEPFDPLHPDTFHDEV